MPEPNEGLFHNFEKCANYSVFSIMIMNTISSMKRFSKVPQEELISKVYEALKSRAAKAQTQAV